MPAATLRLNLGAEFSARRAQKHCHKRGVAAPLSPQMGIRGKLPLKLGQQF